MGTVAVDLALEEAPNEEQRPEKEVASRRLPAASHVKWGEADCLEIS